MKICSLLMLLGFSSCSYFKHYPEDNYVEEMAEQVIDGYTGLDLDFSPYSKEK